MKKRERRSNKWVLAREQLLALVDVEPDHDPITEGPVFGEIPPGLYPKEPTPADIEKLMSVLGKVRRSPLAYSLALQAFLAAFGQHALAGVFNHDFSVPDRGRPFSRLSLLAWHLHLPYREGWRRVAKELIPKEYARDPEKAATKVRQAAQSVIAFKKSVYDSIFSDQPAIEERLEEVLWIEGLDDIASEVIAAKCVNREGVRLSKEAIAELEAGAPKTAGGVWRLGKVVLAEIARFERQGLL